MGFLWGSAAASLSCGVPVGSPKPLTGPADPARGYLDLADFRFLMTTFGVTQCHRSGLPARGNSASIASLRRSPYLASPCSERR
jgi:hypothetical protein